MEQLTPIVITDTDEGAQSVSEVFLGGRLEVTSRSGISLTEARLLEALASFPSPAGKLLVLGNRTGVLAMAAVVCIPGLAAEVSSMDLHHHRAVERNLARNPCPWVSSRCEPDVRERGHYDIVCLQVSKGSFSDELIQDLLQQCHQALKKGGRCFVASEE
ncbi:MAG: class I SAM-dependent methyltransferase [Planctomycetes bacterium]|nr:class I SAM-dependent methyltransferase [Planctomycetota bacterium]